MEADEVVEELGLVRHVEGGWFRETWREAAGTAIYYLLAAGEASRQHRVDKTEVWHFYAGDPLELTVAGEPMVLGADIGAGQRPQAVVPAGVWQSARPLGAWTLVGCTVAPAFDFAGFELAQE
jgi:uncharacterized protein